MKNFFKKHGQFLAICVAVFVGILLIVSSLSMLAKYKSEITAQSSSAAQYNTLLAENVLEDKLDEYTVKAIEISAILADKTETDVKDYLLNLQNTDHDIIFTRYFNRYDALCDADGSTYTGGEDVAWDYYLTNFDKAGYVGTYDDTQIVSDGAMSVIGFYAPVKDSSSCKGVVLYYTRQTIVELFGNSYTNEKAEFTVVCTLDGKIISGLPITEGGQVYDYLRLKTGDKEISDKTRQYVLSNTDGVVYATIEGVEYLISVGTNREVSADLAIVELYRVDALYASSLALVEAIIGVVLTFALIAVAVVVYLILSNIKMNRTILHMDTKDLLLNCYNREGFCAEAEKILSENANSYFAVVVMQLRHFKHMRDTLGESEINSLLKYINMTIRKSLRIEETYGHLEEGNFALLMHAKNRQDLLERLKIHRFLAKQFKGISTFDILPRYGVYEYIKAEKSSVAQMMDYAIEANNTVVSATVENAGMQFNFYSDELRQIRIANETIELRMEGALQNGEFQVFYQPKFNLNTKKQDGCEALVRWYDAETNQYNRPALFMQLFESNGFVVKLDKYVYTKVCEYISYSIAKGRTVYPVSVNISRVTATQTDFVGFYTSVKKKYNVPDGLIMIEFTESFAYENYETLHTIVEQLHKNGFKCSIDDFGCGYSSYRILKSLPMDEIKLDKFFLEKSDSQQRDDDIYESIVQLAKKLHMKVTQEGVETREELEKVYGFGCDCVQGYYYSHPLGINDYLTFIADRYGHNILT